MPFQSNCRVLLAGIVLTFITTQKALGQNSDEATYAGGAVVKLDGTDWVASMVASGAQELSQQEILMSIPATVPGDLLTDLQRAGKIGDPLYELNFKNSSLWGDANMVWYYTKKFDIDLSDNADMVLVLEGVKMGATILLNEVVLGTVTNQFERYTFPLSLKDGMHVLSIRFDGTPTNGRFMACSGGWDWGPYSTVWEGLDHIFTKGIWKSVYIVKVPAKTAAITHVVPHTFFLGKHLVSPLVDGDHAGFVMQVGVHLRGGPDAVAGSLHVDGSWGVSTAVNVQLAPREERKVTLNLSATASQVKLWWPRGMGEQNLYNISVSFTGLNVVRRVGFRVAALVTGNDSDPSYVSSAESQEGSDSHGWFLRVNGAGAMTFGASVIPMDNMEGRYSASAHRQMVQSAAEGRMNLLRVWGGGVFLPQVFYDAADELGVMVYHDMMYTTTSRTHEPTGSDSERLEIIHNVRRLAAHPSIVVWNSCNECSAKGLYASFVMSTVAQEDRSRPIWPGSPSSGWISGVHKLNSLPNGRNLSGKGGGDPDYSATIEVHGPYYNGNGWPAVNQAPYNQLSIPDIRLPLRLKVHETGLNLPNSLTSEFGASVFSSFESMSPTLAEAHWSVHGGMQADDCTGTDPTNGFWRTCKGGNPMAERNYPCDDIILGYFGEEHAKLLDETGEAAFKRQLWQCMLGQALLMKSEIESQRAQNTFGIWTWQLNEIWPTGGWGSLEYGTVGFTAGQILGGRWRPLHHFMRQSLYATVMATCGVNGTCYIKNDGIVPYEGTVDISALQLSGESAGTFSSVVSLKVSLPAGPGKSKWFNASSWNNYLTGNFVFTSDVYSGDKTLLSHHVILPKSPQNLTLPATKLSLSVGDIDADGAVPIAVASTAPALFVTLTTAAQGRFSENCFLVPQAGKAVTVKFLPFTAAGPFDKALLKSSLRIEDLFGNMPARGSRSYDSVVI